MKRIPPLLKNTTGLNEPMVFENSTKAEENQSYLKKYHRFSK
jgi:hypothetical protein